MLGDDWVDLTTGNTAWEAKTTKIMTNPTRLQPNLPRWMRGPSKVPTLGLPQFHLGVVSPFDQDLIEDDVTRMERSMKGVSYTNLHAKGTNHFRPEVAPSDSVDY